MITLSTGPFRSAVISIAVFLSTQLNLSAQAKPDAPVVTVDLQPLGAAADLFANNSGDRYQQRGAICLFWSGSERIAVAFNTTPRFSKNEKPEPLQIRLLIFDLTGKQLYERDWNFGDEGPAAASSIDIEPGPENSIMVVHVNEPSTIGAAVPEGNSIQLLNPDLTLRQRFYVPSTSSYIAAWPSSPDLVVQRYFSDQHSVISWYAGTPLGVAGMLVVPAHETPKLVGPNAVAQSICSDPHHCSTVRVYATDHTQWSYTSPSADLNAVPRAFIGPKALLVELQHSQRPGKLVVVHAEGAAEEMPDLPGGMEVLDVSGISDDGKRVSLNTGNESKLCGLGFFCGERSESFTLDIPEKKTLFRQKLSGNGGTSALSPDGKHLAIFDKNKLAVYALQ